ncbi:hypothetical protein LSTR_LSTR009054 [Laodelphax striatellus]|uniref:Uncharacterized protein n=1 Tax=Laodelphax striatellus TaxID=195883 RepID=A0A482WJH0_LAOST|nr:hypothetical protein LSTR_LSTR009054 [Laodelphax striatellus]
MLDADKKEIENKQKVESENQGDEEEVGRRRKDGDDVRITEEQEADKENEGLIFPAGKELSESILEVFPGWGVLQTRETEQSTRGETDQYRRLATAVCCSPGCHGNSGGGGSTLANANAPPPRESLLRALQKK